MATIRFIGQIAFDPASGEVWRGSLVTRLEPQPAAVLRALVARPGEVLSHEELRRAVWDGSTHVKLHDALHYCVRQVRAALGDSARQPRFIETIPRRGYRLRPDCLAGAPAAPRLRTWGVRLALAAALAAAAALVERRPNNHHALAVTALNALHDLVY